MFSDGLNPAKGSHVTGLRKIIFFSPSRTREKIRRKLKVNNRFYVLAGESKGTDVGGCAGLFQWPTEIGGVHNSPLHADGMVLERVPTNAVS